MSWHEHLQQLPGKGTITITSGATSFTSMIAHYADDFQPIVNFAISVVGVLSGITALVVGHYAIKEKRQKIKMDAELHATVMQKEQLEILELKKRYESD